MLSLVEGLIELEGCCAKAMLILEGFKVSWLFTEEESSSAYECVRVMCTQGRPFDYSMEACDKFEETLEESICSRVLPALKYTGGGYMLTELCYKWSNYKVMAKCLQGFFSYLSEHFKNVLLEETSKRFFRELVLKGTCCRSLDVAVDLIDRYRDEIYFGKKLVECDPDINQDCDEIFVDKLLKNFSVFLVEVGEQGNTYYYYDIFENSILEKAAFYYQSLASRWRPNLSPADYSQKAIWCASKEKEIASQYLHETSIEKLIQVVRSELSGQTEKAEGSHVSSTYQDLDGSSL